MKNLLILATLVMLGGLTASGAVVATQTKTDTTVKTKTVHALSLIGEPALAPGFDHFPYVNPDAPKGGTAKMWALGSFDTLNPFIPKGDAANGLGLIYDTLMKSSLDEDSAEYGLIAHSVTVPDDQSWVIFHLRPEARWHDGTPLTPEDVVFSFNTLKEKGDPYYRFYYANVVKAEKVGAHDVKFTFDQAGNRELPQIMGQLVVLPAHYWKDRDFTAANLDVPLGSGAYKVAEVAPGTRVIFQRVPDYWGRDLPVNRGQDNFDRIQYEYFRDPTVALEAFKAGQFDFQEESSSKAWATQYDFAALNDGRVIKQEIPHQRPTGMQGFAFNLRKTIFADWRVRKALALAFDFEWANANLFYGQYTRTESYFSNSELAATGLPQGEELALLNSLHEQLPERIFTEPVGLPKTDGSGRDRALLRQAQGLLKQAGWIVRDGVLVHSETGQPLAFEMLIVQPAFERIALAFQTNLKRLGVTMTPRLVETAQYINRLREYDFDMMVYSVGQSNSPGNEQREFFGSEAANRPGSRNLMGIKDPAVDALIEKVIFAPDRRGLVTATHALDRVLLHNWYVVPNWHIQSFRLAWWDKFGHPNKLPGLSHGFPGIWWSKSAEQSAN